MPLGAVTGRRLSARARCYLLGVTGLAPNDYRDVLALGRAANSVLWSRGEEYLLLIFDDLAADRRVAYEVRCRRRMNQVEYCVYSGFDRASGQWTHREPRVLVTLSNPLAGVPAFRRWLRVQATKRTGLDQPAAFFICRKRSPAPEDVFSTRRPRAAAAA